MDYSSAQKNNTGLGVSSLFGSSSGSNGSNQDNVANSNPQQNSFQTTSTNSFQASSGANQNTSGGNYSGFDVGNPNPNTNTQSKPSDFTSSFSIDNSNNTSYNNNPGQGSGGYDFRNNQSGVTNTNSNDMKNASSGNFSSNNVSNSSSSNGINISQSNLNNQTSQNLPSQTPYVSKVSPNVSYSFSNNNGNSNAYSNSNLNDNSNANVNSNSSDNVNANVNLNANINTSTNTTPNVPNDKANSGSDFAKDSSHWNANISPYQGQREVDFRSSESTKTQSESDYSNNAYANRDYKLEESDGRIPNGQITNEARADASDAIDMFEVKPSQQIHDQYKMDTGPVKTDPVKKDTEPTTTDTQTVIKEPDYNEKNDLVKPLVLGDLDQSQSRQSPTVEDSAKSDAPLNKDEDNIESNNEPDVNDKTEPVAELELQEQSGPKDNEHFENKVAEKDEVKSTADVNKDHDKPAHVLFTGDSAETEPSDNKGDSNANNLNGDNSNISNIKDKSDQDSVPATVGADKEEGGKSVVLWSLYGFLIAIVILTVLFLLLFRRNNDETATLQNEIAQDQLKVGGSLTRPGGSDVEPNQPQPPLENPVAKGQQDVLGDQDQNVGPVIDENSANNDEKNTAESDNMPQIDRLFTQKEELDGTDRYSSKELGIGFNAPTGWVSCPVDSYFSDDKVLALYDAIDCPAKDSSEKPQMYIGIGSKPLRLTLPEDYEIGEIDKNYLESNLDKYVVSMVGESKQDTILQSSVNDYYLMFMFPNTTVDSVIEDFVSSYSPEESSIEE